MQERLIHSRRGVILSASALALSSAALAHRSFAEEKSGGGEREVGATEDLMREHGVLRRCLILYSEAAAMLRNRRGMLDAKALSEAATLFRAFGEQYHEKMLEEQFVFPALKSSRPEVGQLTDVLVAQHRRGQQLTDYIIAATSKGRISTDAAEPLMAALDSMVRMYRSHAAREDTVIFPAWKKAVPADRLTELAEQFEDIEHKQFGKDGFDDAVDRISRAEQALGIGELSFFTAPQPKGR